MSEKKLLFKVTAADCRWDYYRGSGKGGQARNKTENCVRCTHVASGAIGRGEDGRSKDLNKRLAFERMANTDVFQKWVRVESMRRSGELALIEEKIDRMMATEIEVEAKDVHGRWVPWAERFEDPETK